jgi:predicted heme/steroid binding protein
MDKSLQSVKTNLTNLGFFKYVDNNNLDKVIEETFKEYANDGIINFPDEFLNRIFFIDAESISEQDGIKSQIEGMLSFFKSIGIKIKIGKYVEEFDDYGEYSKREITINKEVYEVDLPTSWSEGFHSGVKLIREILEDNDKEEDVYGLFMDECSIMILLDDKLYDYLIELIPKNSQFRPIEIN